MSTIASTPLRQWKDIHQETLGFPSEFVSKNEKFALVWFFLNYGRTFPREIHRFCATLWNLLSISMISFACHSRHPIRAVRVENQPSPEFACTNITTARWNCWVLTRIWPKCGRFIWSLSNLRHDAISMAKQITLPVRACWQKISSRAQLNRIHCLFEDF